MSFKPLFNQRLLADAQRAFAPVLDAEQSRIAASWAAGAAAGTLLGRQEKPLQAQFIGEILDRLLGYRQLVGSDGLHHLEPETSSKNVKGYRPPDARLGWFGQHAGAAIDRTRAVLELKAPGADLDARQSVGYGRLTPVEQAFGYAAKVDGCRWVLVSNFIELRLYRTDRGQGYGVRFELRRLADPDDRRLFLWLFGRETLLGLEPDGESAVERLATHTHVEEQRISRDFYVFYRDLRLELFHQLRRDNPPPSGVQRASHEVRLLECTQKLLDRCLFIGFCQDTGLLPPGVLQQALTAQDTGFVSISRWQQLCGLFRAVDRGHPSLRIPAYNGGLFAEDAELDALQVDEASLDGLLALAGYDFASELDVNILGHIFEQSITDLESLRAEIRGTVADRQRSRRKRDGIFYTPESITRFMVARTIGGWLAEREAEIEARHRTGRPGPLSNETRLQIQLDLFEVLGRIKVLDPACGSGAFLVAAFDYLLTQYERVNRAIAELQGRPYQRGLFDLDRRILQDNLFGVDLNAESVEITKLSLWLKTARPDRPLDNLDANIRCGNSLVEPPASDAPPGLHAAFAALPDDSRPLDWNAAFPEVMARGGFDIVVGNPPYVRQEALGALKPYLAARYAGYHGAADLYVYFYERGLERLAPGGKLSYIVTNKWLRAGYGEPLRRLFSERAELEELLDFGHAPIFEDADTFPCILVARRRSEAAVSEGGGESESAAVQVRVCSIPRERPAELSLDNYVHEHGYAVPWSRYGAEPWSLEPPEVEGLMERIRERGVALAEFVGVKPYRGVLTGLNEAFLIDEATRAELIRQDPGCSAVIKPYLRGQDIGRWAPDWQGLWMIVLKSSQNQAWPWSEGGERAEAIFGRTYPSVHGHLKAFEERLRARQDQGRYWWELRSCDYYAAFEEAKIVHTDITWRPQFAFSDAPIYLLNTAYLWSTNDLYALSVMNSPLLWSFMWRNAQHGKDEALRIIRSFSETLPIAEPTPELRREVEERAGAALELTRDSRRETRELLDWLRLEHGLDKPGRSLESFADLTADDFAAEVRKRRPKGVPRLTPKAVTELTDLHRQYADAEQTRAARLRALERRLSDLVIQAYRLDDADIDLLWRTAPPRMPGLR